MKNIKTLLFLIVLCGSLHAQTIYYPAGLMANGQFLPSATAIYGMASSDSVQYYDSNGRVRRIQKEWTGIITPSTASGATIDISSAGFGSITNIQIQAAANTASATSVPLVSLKSYTTTQVTVNIVMSNNSTIANLLQPIIGLIFPSSVTGITLHVLVKGY